MNFSSEVSCCTRTLRRAVVCSAGATGIVGRKLLAAPAPLPLPLEEEEGTSAPTARALKGFSAAMKASSCCSRLRTPAGRLREPEAKFGDTGTVTLTLGAAAAAEAAERVRDGTPSPTARALKGTSEAMYRSSVVIAAPSPPPPPPPPRCLGAARSAVERTPEP